MVFNTTSSPELKNILMQLPSFYFDHILYSSRLKAKNPHPMMIYCINSISQEAEMKENDISTYVKYSHLCENELPTFCKRGLSQNLI